VPAAAGLQEVVLVAVVLLVRLVVRRLALGFVLLVELLVVGR
jgi:hypothetical protein